MYESIRISGKVFWASAARIWPFSPMPVKMPAQNIEGFETTERLSWFGETLSPFRQLIEILLLVKKLAASFPLNENDFSQNGSSDSKGELP